MSELLKRMAEAMADTDHDAEVHGIGAEMDRFVRYARAALSELEEPTEAILQAMAGRATVADGTTLNGARDIWYSAIHAALTPPACTGKQEA